MAIGAFPDGQAATVAARPDSKPLEVGAIEDHEVVRELAHGEVRQRQHRANRLALGCERVRSADVFSASIRPLNGDTVQPSRPS